MSIGQSAARVDAYDKVTGAAQYTDDMCPANALRVKLVRSTIANGKVLSVDVSEAVRVPGVVKIVTCFDAPQRPFPTAGHPWSVEKAHQDIADRYLLARRVLVYGDEVAAVIAEDEVSAARAAKLVKVEYEEYPPLTDVQDALRPEATTLHDEYPGNVLAHTVMRFGEGVDRTVQGRDCEVVEGEYWTPTVQHCHIELPVSFAWMEKDRIHVVSSTQIPHILRRIVSQALGIPVGRVRIVKPYIGGGFGNKQDALVEPLAAWLTTCVGGRAVRIELTREETFCFTRVRHAIQFRLKTAVLSDGAFLARKAELWSNQGGYASHGHAICANAASGLRNMYPDRELSYESDAWSVYTNIATGGAMRAYGIPQQAFALECHVDDIALRMGMDPLELRKINCMKLGYTAAGTGIACHSTGLVECMERGRDFIGWDGKRKLYRDQTGPLRRGVGMAIFCYKTGVYPISLETASARMVLNQDGSAQVVMGATEIGQGADTVFCQMAGQTAGIRPEDIRVVSTQDTDTAPFDTGAYASRQTYVSGMALKKTAESFKARILAYASRLLGRPAAELDLIGSAVVEQSGGKTLLPLSELALEAFYSLKDSEHITAEESVHCKDNTFAFGACFAEVEVDIPVGKVRIIRIIDVLDSGKIINPATAAGQVHGGMSMSLGYALGEELRYDANARPLNGNFLDYKLPTSLDTPDLYAGFVETDDPTGPYGNKSLGENPAIPPAPAIRNAVLHATGVAFNRLPLNPQRLVEGFISAGLIKEARQEAIG